VPKLTSLNVVAVSILFLLMAQQMKNFERGLFCCTEIEIRTLLTLLERN